MSNAISGTVWVVTNVTDDISSAKGFGALRLINHRYIYPDELQGATNRLPSSFLFNLRTAASMFRPATDYLLLAGDNLQVVAMTALLAARYPFFRVLRWDRREGVYIPVAIEGHDI